MYRYSHLVKLPHFLGFNCNRFLLPGSRNYVLYKPLIDFLRLALSEIVTDICFFGFYATRWALIEQISFQGV
jgi:hypothetical protein